MKKLIFSALVATALWVSSCGKDDDNGGGSTSLTGDWYFHTFYKNVQNKGSQWVAPDNCAQKSYWSISDKKIKYEWYGLEGSNCKYTPIYYNYTVNNGALNASIADDSPNGTKGTAVFFKYEMKEKELILRYIGNGGEEIYTLHKKGVSYSHLDPFIGVWKMTKYVVGQQEFIVKEGECLQGAVVSSSIGFTLYLNFPEQNGQCKKTINTYEWVKEGNKYYNVTDPQNKEELAFVFSDNNTKLSYSTPSDNGLVTIYLTKVR